MIERLKKLRKTLKLNQTSFGKHIGMSQPGYAQIEKGDRSLNDRLIKLICIEFNVNENWLRTGNGEMFVKTEDDVFKAFAEKYNLDEEEQALARYCLEMTHEERQFLIQHILKMADVIRGKVKLNQSLKPDKLKPDKELTVDEKLERIRPQLEASERGEIFIASTSTSGQDKKDKAI